MFVLNITDSRYSQYDFYISFCIADLNFKNLLFNFRSFVCLLSSLLFVIAYRAYESNRKAMNRTWSNQKANPALKTKTENTQILQIDKIQ